MSDPSWSSLTLDEFDHAENAIHDLTPLWTVRVLHALQRHGPLRFAEVVRAVPDFSTYYAGVRLQRMRVDQLVTRTRTADSSVYELAFPAESLTPVFDALTRWSRDHVRTAENAHSPEIGIEWALGLLNRRHLFTFLQLLDQSGPLRQRDIHRRLPHRLALPTIQYHASQLERDGFLARTTPTPRSPLSLTPRAQSLPRVAKALATWQEHRALGPISSPAQAATLRTTAIASRHPAQTPPRPLYRKSDLFSHPDAPEAPPRAWTPPAPGRHR